MNFSEVAAQSARSLCGRSAQKRDRLSHAVIERSPSEAFVAAGFRGARDPSGRLAFLDADEERRILDGLPLVEVNGS